MAGRHVQYKVAVLGSEGVGKTALIIQFCKQMFVDNVSNLPAVYTLDSFQQDGLRCCANGSIPVWDDLARPSTVSSDFVNG